MAQQASAEVVRVDAEIMGAEIVQAQTAAEVDMQISTARKYPRSISRVKEKVLELATVDAETAAECWYALPRGGKVIEGPGTRMAEIVAASYGNLRAGCRVIAVEDKHVVAQGACHDLENNVLIQSEVRRRITGRDGRRYNDDMIVVTGNAAASIAFRNAIFKVVPKALLKGVMDKVKKIGMGEGRTITEHRKAIVEYFKGMGIEPSAVAKVVKRRTVEDITLEDVETLRGLATAIKEGTTSIEETFGGKPAPKTASVPRSKIKAEPKAATPPAAEAPEEPGGGVESCDPSPAPPVAMVQCQGADCKLPGDRQVRQTAAVNVGTKDKPVLMCPNCAKDFKPAKRGRPKKNEAPEFEECLLCGGNANLCGCEPGSEG